MSHLSAASVCFLRSGKGSNRMENFTLCMNGIACKFLDLNLKLSSNEMLVNFDCGVSIWLVNNDCPSFILSLLLSSAHGYSLLILIPASSNALERWIFLDLDDMQIHHVLTTPSPSSSRYCGDLLRNSTQILILTSIWQMRTVRKDLTEAT